LTAPHPARDDRRRKGGPKDRGRLAEPQRMMRQKEEASGRTFQAGNGRSIKGGALRRLSAGEREPARREGGRALDGRRHGAARAGEGEGRELRNGPRMRASWRAARSALARRRVRDRTAIPAGRKPEEMEGRARPPAPSSPAETPNCNRPLELERGTSQIDGIGGLFL
jgi:hypothetical protein